MTAMTIDRDFHPGSASSALDHSNDRSPAMYASTELRLRNAQALRQGDLKAAANARLLRAHRAVQARPIRARFGRSIIRIGERLAAEPHLEPAPPR